MQENLADSVDRTYKNRIDRYRFSRLRCKKSCCGCSDSKQSGKSNRLGGAPGLRRSALRVIGSMGRRVNSKEKLAGFSLLRSAHMNVNC